MAATRWIPALAGMTLLTGCALFHSGPEAAGADADAPVEEKSGLDLEAEKLLETDRKFAARALEIGAPDAAREYWDADGMRLKPTGQPIIGPELARASMLAEGPALLSWEPRFAEVFAPGDWGWTWGEWQEHERGAGGRRLAQGRYVTLWKKQADGSWKVRLDTGNSAPAN